MINEEVLDKALIKKNKEIDLLNERNEKMKQEIKAQKKNLMNSITNLQKKVDQFELESRTEKRAEIINKLRNERKDQETTILLLRKYILNIVGDNKEEEMKKIDKYLINKFKEKYGEQRYISYEELKIKYDELEKNYASLKKLKGGAPNTTRGYMRPKEKEKKVPESEIQLMVVKRFKAQLDEYDLKIKNLENENNFLKKQKEEMENKQKEMIEKFKNFNEEMTKMRGIYNDIEQELKTNASSKINETNLKLAKALQENEQLKGRIEELIKIGEESKKIEQDELNKEQDELNKIKNENEIYKNLLNKNKEEIKVYKEELENFRGEINKIDSRGLVKLKKLENEKDNILRDKNELQIKMENFEEIVKHKDNQILNLKNNIEALKEQLKEKEEEIEMLKSKIEEFEKIIKNSKNINEKESDYEYSQSHFND